MRLTSLIAASAGTVISHGLLAASALMLASAPASAQSSPGEEILPTIGGYRLMPGSVTSCDLFHDKGEHIGCGKAAALRQRMASGFQIEDPMDAQWWETREAAGDTDLLDNNLDIELIPASSTITGSNTMTVRSNVNGLSEFSFMLRSNYTISSVLVDGNSRPVASFGSYGRRVTLPRVYNAGEVFTVRVAYSGVAVSRGFGSIEFQTQGGQPIIATLSQPYFAATWWPVKDGDFGQPGDNTDKSTATLAFTTPSNLKTTSNGLLQSVTTPAAGKVKYTWRTNYPTPTYLFAFGSTNYSSWTRTWNWSDGVTNYSMPVEFNLYPGSDTTANRAAWETCISMLTVFSNALGVYPFVAEKYGMYQFPFGGGMEHQTNTGQSSFAESITAHELGHQWLGDWVTCRTWNDIWLNEGGATYTEALWSERKPGSTGLPALFAAMAARRPSATLINDTVYVYDVTNMNRIFQYDTTYEKGAWVYHMLRKEMGDTQFFGFLRAWLSAYGGSAATTNDMVAFVSAYTGRNFSRFFNQWVFGTGAPVYATGTQNVSINGQNYLRVSIRQTQLTSYGQDGYFDAPLDLRVNWTGGTRSFPLRNNARSEWFLIPLGAGSAPATSVVLDENNWILAASKTSETYQAGPAKLVSVSPAIGSTTSIGGPASITITFSENVNASASNFSITGPGGAVPFTFAYNAADLTATLTPSAPLAGGSYTVTALDTITSVTGGARLDGEIVLPGGAGGGLVNGGPLPSGDGLALGNAVFSFTVPNACPADYDSSGFVDSDDFIGYVADFALGCDGVGSPDPACSKSADFDNSGFVDSDDFIAYVNAFNTPCP
jgi:hypothetical protein